MTISQIAARSRASGRSTKNISSKRPLRRNSGGELRHVVGGRHHEHRFLLLLHPGKETAEDAGGCSAIGVAAALAAGETFFDIVFEFGRQLVAAAEQDDGMAVALGPVQEVLQSAREDRVGLVVVELQVAHEHDVLRGGGGEHALQQLQGLEGIGTRGGAVVGGVHEAVGGRPGGELAFDGGDFSFGRRLLCGGDGESGITGPQVGGEFGLHGGVGVWGACAWLLACPGIADRRSRVVRALT